jgi:hypothetical protein
MVIPCGNFSPWEGDTGGSQILGQPELHSQILSQNQTNKQERP